MFLKKKIIIPILLIILALAMPYVINLEYVGTQIKNKISRALPVPVRFDNLSWRWLPVPSLFLNEVRMSRENLDIIVSRAAVRFFPAGLWRQGSILQLVLVRPDIRLRVTDDLKGPSALVTSAGVDDIINRRFPLPVRIIQGRIQLSELELFKNTAGEEDEAAVIDQLNARLVMAPGQAELVMSCRLPFARSFSARISAEERGPGADSESTSSAPPTPRTYWTANLSARQVNLDPVRRLLVDKAGSNPVIAGVTDIIRGGRLRSAGYEFSGFSDEINDLKAMTIKAEAVNTGVTVPGSDLPLEDVSGRVIISEGELVCRQASGRSGGILFRNGQLNLDLLGSRRQVDLGLDAEAALSEVPDLLQNYFLKNNPRLVSELETITRAEGHVRARVETSGLMQAGPLPVTVAVIESDARIAYPRLEHPATIASGWFIFAGDSVKWSRVKGSVGPNRIRNAAGELSWKHDLRIDLDEFEADLDAAGLLAELRAWPVVKEKLPELINSAEGSLTVRDLSLAGELSDLENMTYDLAVSMENLHLDTPLLPKPLLIRSGQTRLGSGPIMASDCFLDIVGQDMEITVDMEEVASMDLPGSWRKSRGRVILSGTMRQAVADWIKKKRWVPPAYFPRSPCEFDPLTIAFDRDSLRVQGVLAFTESSPLATIVKIDSHISDQAVAVREMNIQAAGEEADLKFLWTPLPDSNIDMEFSGRLSKATADRILASNKLVYGTLSGNLRLKYFFDKPSENICSGSLRAAGINIFTRNNVFRIRQADIIGRRSRVEIKKAVLGFNEEIFDARGHFALDDSAGIITDLVVSSDSVSLANLRRMREALTGGRDGIGREEQPLGQRSRNLSGQVDFNFKKFVFQPEKNIPAAEDLPDFLPNDFVWRDLAGILRLSADEGRLVIIDSGNLCGLNTTGELRLPPEQSTLRISAGQSGKADFEAMLDCLGLKDQKLTGKFTLEAELIGTPDDWQSGRLQLVSHDGQFQKLTFLSKLFSILNVTDIFSLRNIRNIFSTGYPYSEMRLAGHIADNRLLLADSFVKGPGLDFFFSGPVDLDSGRLDLLMFVKPFGTIDAIVTFIPLVGKDLGGGNQSIAFIPINVGGTLGDPRFSLLDNNQ
ncbi:MAG: AsmA-like C-terminal region-containing protein [Desulfosudaceae bacterium]